MRLISLALTKLHGALSLDVNFNEDVTLLVGINGSGKTSVVNCVDILLRPDMRRLATLEYERLCLSFQEGDVTYKLIAKKKDARVVLSINGTPEKLDPITIDLLKHIDPDDEVATRHYAQLSPEPHEKPLWDLLKSLPRPIVIALDRSISAEIDESIYQEATRESLQQSSRARSPLAYVGEVTSAGYARYRRKAIAADDELKAEIVMSALQEPDFLSSGRAMKPMTSGDLNKLEEKVTSYLSKTVKTGNVARQVRKFFQSSRQVSRRPYSQIHQDLLLDIVGARYRQIDNLAKAFNNFETKNATAFHQLGEYLETVNRFFIDSKKELFFDESTGRLVFSFVRNGVRDEAKRGIQHLSSGERQLIILFTFLAFASSKSSVFIVDEPELSLHPKWQHEFMDAFLKLRPDGAQLLLATHSPEIVGRHKSACVTLRARVE